MRYSTRFIHRINPRPEDVGPDVDLTPAATVSLSALTAVLWGIQVIPKNGLREFRVEADKIVVFPRKGPWHSIILTPVLPGK